jgi:hypothetical protein
MASSAETYICKLKVAPNSSAGIATFETHRFERKNNSFSHSLDYREQGDFKIFEETSIYILINRGANAVMINKNQSTIGQFYLNVPLNYQPSYGSCSKKGG